MITAVCLNPSVDRTLVMDHFVRGATNRVVDAREDAGGKGINVAVTAARLGAEAGCVCLLRVERGALIEKKLAENGVRCDCVRADGGVRVNLKLVDRSESLVTEVNEPGLPMVERDLDDLARMILSRAAAGDMIAFCGSVPPGCPSRWYRDMIKALSGRCRCALDADGEMLRQGIMARPFLLKPNRAELEALSGRSLPTLSAVKAAARVLVDGGCDVVAVSLGAEGAMAVDADCALYARALRVPVRSTVGAGDAMLAGLLAGFADGLSISEAFRLGMGCAAACITREGTQPIDRPLALGLSRDICMDTI